MVSHDEANDLDSMVGTISDAEMTQVPDDKGYTLLSVDNASDEHIANDDFGDASGSSGETNTKLQTATSSGVDVWGKSGRV